MTEEPGTLGRSDALRRDDVTRARGTAPEERARQALEMIDLGIRLQRAAIARRFPDEPEAAIEQRLRLWLARDLRWLARGG